MLIKWDERSAFDLDLSKALVVLCVGSTEQHSDYLPLGTDSFIGTRITEEAAKAAKSQVYMLPTQRFGFSPHHRAFPGYITLGQETMFHYLYDVCSCVYENGAAGLMIVNSHGGNQTCLQNVVNELGSKLGKRAVLVRYWDLIAKEIGKIRESEAGGMGHAGELETSLMMYFYPELVQTDRIDERPVAQGTEWHHPDMFASNRIFLYKPFNEYSPKGNIGQAHLGSPEKGGKIAERVISELSKLMDFQLQNKF